MATTYSEKLKNPLWQKKRLRVLNRDNFTCVMCSDTETELHIHHKEYKAGKKPWEYEDDNFQTLCKHCHEITEAYKPLGYFAVVAAKAFNDVLDVYVVSTIFHNKKGSFLASIDFCYKSGNIQNMDMIDREQSAQLESLFNHAQKLILNG